MGALVVPYEQVSQAFSEDPDAVHDVVDQASDTIARGNPEKKAELVARWHRAMASLASADQGDTILSTATDDLASRLQSMIADQAAQAGQVDTLVPQQVVTTSAGVSTAVETLGVKFDNADLVGWLGTALIEIFDSKRAAFLPFPEVPEAMPDVASLALFSDWGTGRYGAPIIANTISKLPTCDVVLHLGDTYYSGTKDEVKDNLLHSWPQRPGALHRALNGNHEMYSGGSGYFSALSSFFKQPSSCVALQNAHWLILGLDTAYDDFDVSAEQAAWVTRMIDGAGPKRKVILCSHHQPFSALDDQGPELQQALGPLLEAQRIEAWFWGHEHRLVVYEPHSKWGVKGRCIGHGGFPAYRDTAVGAKGNLYQWIHLKLRPHAPEAMLFDGPNFWVTAAPESYSPHGWALLELDGPAAWESYRTPDNIAIGPKSRL